MGKRIWLLIIAAVFMTAGIVTQADAAAKGLSRKEKGFIEKAGSGGMMEVQLGQLAKEKAKSQDVKNFGERMVTDHGKANDQLKQVAQAKGVTLPTSLKREHKKMVEKLQKVSGADFDKAYMQDMVKDHVKDVAEFQEAQKTVKDPELKQWVDTVLPKLEEHLQMAKEVAGKVGVDVKKMK